MSQSDIIDLTPSGDEKDDDHDTDDASSSYNSVEEISPFQFYQTNCNTTAEDNKDYALALALSESEHNHDHATATRMPPPPPRRRQQRRGKNFRCGIGLEDLKSKPGRVTPWMVVTCHHRFCVDCLSDLNPASLIRPRWRPRRRLGIRYPVPRTRVTHRLTSIEIQYILHNEVEAWRQYAVEANVASIEHRAVSSRPQQRENN